MRPPCDKYGGIVIPEHDFNGRVTCVKCTLCGNRHWREFKLRRPSRGDRDAPHRKENRR